MPPVITTDSLKYTYSVPQEDGVLSSKLILLTVGGILVTGPWTGRLGDSYLGWAPLPRTDKLVQSFINAKLVDLRIVSRIFGDGKSDMLTVETVNVGPADDRIQYWQATPHWHRTA